MKVLIGVALGSAGMLMVLLLLPDSAMEWFSQTRDEWKVKAAATTTPMSSPRNTQPDGATLSSASAVTGSSPSRFAILPTGVPATPPALDRPEVSTPLPGERLIELRSLALDLINRDRSDHDLPPVALGSNVAAQLHAEDMLEHEYNGHWWLDGRKPYMVYTQTGGTSYVSENVASSGWTKQRWDESNCDSFLVICKASEPEEEVERAQWDMMYDDAGSNWGHRDNILGSTHRFVNLGIAWNERRTIFVQHFEGGDVAADSPPQLGTDGTLSLKLTKLADGLEIGRTVSVYYDPPPRQKAPAQIDELDSYCVGGGFTTICDGEPIARILRPPPQGSFYSDLGSDEMIADVWTEDSTEFSFLASLGTLATGPGVYTVIVWRDSSGPLLSEAVLELSAIQD